MFIEFDTHGPEDYLGFTGPLVLVYELILRLHDEKKMVNFDWTRGEALAETEGFHPTAQRMFQRVQELRRSHLHDLEHEIARVIPLC